MTVMVIEDDPDNRDLLSLILNDGGYNSLTSEGGIQGLETMREKRGEIEIVLLDLMMQEVDGFQVLKEMGRDEKISDIPVIVVSALDDPNSINRAFDLGAFDYITKPYESISLLARTKAAIKFNKAKVLLKEKNRVLIALNEETEAQRVKLEDNINYLEDLMDILEHKIKNKLVPIQMYSQIHKDLVNDKQLASVLNNIYISSLDLDDSMVQLLFDMKNRVRSKNDSLKEVDLVGLVRSLVHKNEQQLLDYGLTIDSEIGSDVPEKILTDGILLYDILDNLISNGIKYTDPGGKLFIQVYYIKTNERNKIHIGFEDTGIGIEEKNIDKIFLKDFIIPINNYNKSFNRSGKGLYLVKKFVESMGGTIEVESTYGEGTKFTLKMPV